ncbi:MAG: YraN family protein [Christensenellaceae bacterium]|jgi:putative endonuclease|nr:YraN family protein [Christensenellaceae bacterium]
MENKAARKGRAGEDAALLLLEREGLHLLARNLRRAGGEIDLIMEEGLALVFVEVKLRSRDENPARAVDAAKQRRVSRAALAYMAENRWLERPARFDVVEVFFPGGEMRLNHIREAFVFAGGRNYFF